MSEPWKRDYGQLPVLFPGMKDDEVLALFERHSRKSEWLEAENKWLHERRGQVCVERDRWKRERDALLSKLKFEHPPPTSGLHMQNCSVCRLIAACEKEEGRWHVPER